MRNLIPSFTAEQYKKKNHLCKFEAAVLFADIKGFTDMTAQLMKNGKEGAEIIADTINEIFRPALDYVYQNSGFIANFAGDAFNAVFINTNHDKTATVLKTLETAVKIKNLFLKNPIAKTKFGSFELAVKIGISYGNTASQIIFSNHKNASFFFGESIDNAAGCEKYSQKNEITADKTILKNHKEKFFLTFCEIEKLIFKDHKKQFFLINNEIEKIITNLSASESIKDSFKPVDTKIQKEFFPESVLKMKTAGEFRDVISIFISFDDICKNNLKELIELTEKYKAYFNRISFGDKGGFALVIFGAPKAVEKMFRKACSFALEVKNLKNLKPKIGMTFGKAFTGFIGNNQRAEYTAQGEKVNLAARFMTKADEFQILTDEEIFSKINSFFEVELLGKFEYKGYRKKLKTYSLINKKENKEFYSGKLIGRKREIKRLNNLIKPLIKNKFGGMIIVDGSPGMGKSRLIHDFKATLPKHFTTVKLICDEILRKSFNPLIKFLNYFFNQSEKKSRKENKDNFNKKYEDLINTAVNENIKKEFIRTKSFLGALVNLHWENSLYENLDPKRRYDNTLSALKNFFLKFASGNPLIIEIEDIHWIDPDTLNFLNFLTQNIENYPIILLSSSRYNDDNSPFDIKIKDISIHRIDLSSLSKPGTRLILEEKLDKKIPLKTLDLIYNKTEGNPFFIEQMIFYLKEHHLLDEKLNLKDNRISIPAGINGIVAARIDRLGFELKDLVKTASVLGKDFAVNILEEISALPIICPYLKKGESEALWSSLNELIFSFKHALIRETAYEMQLKKILRNIHTKAAEAFEKIYSSNLDPYLFEIAEHYEKSGVVSKTIEYFLKAGEYAKNRFQNEAALKFYTKLLSYAEFKSDIPKLIELYMEIGDIYKLTGDWSESHKYYNLGLSESEKHSIKKYTALSYRNLGWIYLLQGNFTQSINIYKKSLDLFKELEDDTGIAKVKGNMGVAYKKMGEYDTALKLYLEHSEFARKLNDIGSLASSTGNIGNIYIKKGELGKALEYHRESLKLYLEIGDKAGCGTAFRNMGNVFALKEEFEQAMEYYNKKLEIAEELGDKAGYAGTVGNMGNIYFHLDNFDKAMECYQKRLQTAEEIGDKSGYATTIGNIGIIYKDTGNFKKALKCFEIQLKIAEEIQYRSAVIYALGSLGEIYENTGQYNKAMKYYERQFHISEKLEHRQGIYSAAGNIGFVFEMTEEYNKALKFYNMQLKMAEEAKNKKWISETKEKIDNLKEKL